MARELDGISERRQAFDRRFLRSTAAAMEWALRHWLAFVNATNAVITLGAIAVPLMRAAGMEGLAAPLFEAYHALCEQRPERSYFLLGYQMAMDHRMMAIYGSTVLAGLAFAPLRGRVRPLPWRIFLVLILPMAVDGFTQLFGWRVSNWQLRTVTGTLFGVATVWLLYPWADAVIRQMLRR